MTVPNNQTEHTLVESVKYRLVVEDIFKLPIKLIFNHEILINLCFFFLIHSFMNTNMTSFLLRVRFFY